MRLLAQRAVPLLRGARLTAVAMAITGFAHSQQLPKWPTNPNGANQDLQNLQQFDAINNQHSRDQAQAQPQVAKASISRTPVQNWNESIGTLPVQPAMIPAVSQLVATNA